MDAWRRYLHRTKRKKTTPQGECMGCRCLGLNEIKKG